MAEPAQTTFLPAVKKFLTLVVVYTLTAIYGTIWIIQQLPYIWKDYKRYFATTLRTLPTILKEPEVGEHGNLQLKNGIRIHYVAAGRRDKPLMLFLHGFPEFWLSWRHQLRFFQNDYRAVAIDLRGYGDSSKPMEVSAYTIDQLVEDIRLIIEELQYDSCVLVAHDWGGILAWVFSNKYTDMVKKLVVLNAPHPAVFRKFLQQNPKQIQKSWYMFAFQIPYIPEIILKSNDFHFMETAFTKPPMGAKAGTISKEEVEAYKYQFSQPNALTGPINYYRNVFTNRPVETIEWKSLPFPILFIFGTGDQAISQETAIMSRKYAGGVFEMKYLEGVSHWVNQEAPNDVNKLMNQFLRQF